MSDSKELRETAHSLRSIAQGLEMLADKHCPPKKVYVVEVRRCDNDYLINSHKFVDFCQVEVYLKNWDASFTAGVHTYFKVIRPDA
jgi:hypothetical protein